MSATSLSSLPFSTKARDVMIVSNCAALPADLIAAAPAEKLTMATTRPADIKPSRVTTQPTDVGSMTPILPPAGTSGISLAPSTRAPISVRL